MNVYVIHICEYAWVCEYRYIFMIVRRMRVRDRQKKNTDRIHTRMSMGSNLCFDFSAVRCMAAGFRINWNMYWLRLVHSFRPICIRSAHRNRNTLNQNRRTNYGRFFICEIVSHTCMTSMEAKKFLYADNDELSSTNALRVNNQKNAKKINEFYQFPIIKGILDNFVSFYRLIDEMTTNISN